MKKCLVTTEEFEKSSKNYHSGMDVKIGDYKIDAYVKVIDKTYLTIINEFEIDEKYEFIDIKKF